MGGVNENGSPRVYGRATGCDFVRLSEPAERVPGANIRFLLWRRST